MKKNLRNSQSEIMQKDTGDLVPLVREIVKLHRKECCMNEICTEVMKKFTGIEHIKENINDFNLIGLSKKKSVTCAVISGSQEIFHPEVEMPQDRFDAFWNYYISRDKDEKFIAVVRHEGLNKDGTPKNGALIKINIKK